MQSNVTERLNQHAEIQAKLRHFSRNTQFTMLETTLQVHRELGKGVYGVVYEVSVLSGRNNGKRLMFAAKSVTACDHPEQRERIFKSLVREEVAYGYLNALVELRVCPGFPLVHKSFLTSHPKRENYFSSLICLERADGTMEEWLHRQTVPSGARPEAITQASKTIMKGIFQVFMSIVAFAEHLQLVHNDLYLKNILYNAQEQPTALKFRLCNRTFVLDDTSAIFKVSDFGICSSESHLHTSHLEMSKLAQAPRLAPSLSKYDFGHHILEYTNIPPYARDAAVLLRSLQNGAFRLPTPCSVWLKNATAHLDLCAGFSNRRIGMIHNGTGAKVARAMTMPGDLTRFVLEIFNEKFLLSSGLPRDIFSQVSGSPEDSFCLDRTEDTKRSMMFIFGDYARRCQTTASGPSTPAPPSAQTPPTFF